MTDMASTQAEIVARMIPTRRISFDDSFAGVPKHFAQDGDLILSHLTAALSSLFPDGEEFFVRSVRHYRDQITDPVLKQQVKGFIGQESIHGREHREFNARLAELGYRTKLVEKWNRRSLTLSSRLAPPAANLAVTAALEHFTATLAEVVLSNEQARADFGHPDVQNLFVWHSLEESEHKAVAFDVYRAIGGSEWRRVVTMQLIRFGFAAGLALGVTLSVLGDRETYRRGGLAKSLRSLRRCPLLRRAVWDQLGEYTRRGFHPDDRDTTELVRRWRAELFGDVGSLKSKLSSPAA